MLSLIIILAACLRIWGIGFGLPYFEHPDEWAVADEALRMLRTGNFSPFSYTYPTLYVYTQVGLAWLHYAWGTALGIYSSPADINPAAFYIWARTLTAVLGTGCVALTALIGHKLYGWLVGLSAAALLAVLPSVSADAHYVTVDTPASFMTLLAFWAIMRMLHHYLPLQNSSAFRKHDKLASQAMAFLRSDSSIEKSKNLILPGVLVGLAASTKYTCGILIIALTIACLILAWNSSTTIAERLRLTLWYTAIAGFAALLGFTLGTPMWLLEPQRLLADLESIARHYRSGHPGAESSQPALFYWEALRGQAWLLAWLVLAGIGLAIIRRSRADLLLLAVVVPFVLQLSSVRVVFLRNAIPLLPFVILLAAAALVFGIINLITPWQYYERMAKKGHNHNPEQVLQHGMLLYWVLLTLTLILMLQPLRIAFHDEWLRAQPTTRILATRWIEQHAQDGTRIWLEDQTLILPARLRVQGGPPATSHTADWYRSNGFRFVVTNDSIARSDAAALAAFGEAAARFESAGQRHGHSFSIYDLEPGDAANQQRNPSGATLAAGALTLEGYQHLQQVTRGETLALALFWQVNRSIPANYTVFVHLIDAQGNKLAQRDMPPLDGSRPSSSWQPGELIRDDQDLPIPAETPPGRYRLVVGMYDAQTLVSINDSGPIEVGEVKVE